MTLGDAEAKARSTNPWERAQVLLGDIGFAPLMKYLDPKAQQRVCCGWASAYGFVPKEGSANYDFEQDRLRVYDEQDKRFWQRWQPFRILDPFIYVATGNAMSLATMPD